MSYTTSPTISVACCTQGNDYERTPCGKRSRQIGFFSQQAFLAGSAKILVDGALRIEVHRVLCIKLNQPADSLVVCEMEHDSFVHVMVHSRGAADSCSTVVERFTCGVTFVSVSCKSSLWKSWKVWATLPRFLRLCGSFTQCSSSYFLALLMSLSMELMQQSLTICCPKSPIGSYFRECTTGRGFDRHPSVDYISGAA